LVSQQCVLNLQCLSGQKIGFFVCIEQFSFQAAMDWFRKKVGGSLIFLIVIDDLNWCEKQLLGPEDVKIASKSAEHDLALLSSINHSIVDYGTFSVCGALMAGGHTISLDAQKQINQMLANADDKWHIFDKSKFS